MSKIPCYQYMKKSTRRKARQSVKKVEQNMDEVDAILKKAREAMVNTTKIPEFLQIERERQEIVEQMLDLKRVINNLHFYVKKLSNLNAQSLEKMDTFCAYELYQQHKEQFQQEIKHSDKDIKVIHKQMKKLISIKTRLTSIQNEEAKIKKQLITEKKIQKELQRQLEEECVRTDAYTDNLNLRQKYQRAELTDEKLPTILQVENFPTSLQHYDWQCNAYRNVLLQTRMPLVYFLVGQDADSSQFLIKIGSTNNFIARQVLYRNTDRDTNNHFKDSTQILVANAILTNELNPINVELFIRYAFEKKFNNTKAYPNEWFTYYNIAQIDYLNHIFDYVNHHLAPYDKLYQFLQKNQSANKYARIKHILQ